MKHADIMEAAPMIQYITYKRDEVLNNLEFIRNAMSHMEQLIVYVEEQGLGRRDNLDWEDTGARIREYFEDLRRGMSRFGTDITFDAQGITYLENKSPAQIKKEEDDELPF